MIANRLLAFGLGLALASLSTTALAQPGGQGQGQGRFGRGMGMFGGLAQLATNPQVQEELKLSDEQAEKAQALADELREAMMGQFRDLQDLGPDERRSRIEELAREQTEQARAKLKDALDEAQLARLEQIHLQQQGVMAFGDPAVREKLGLEAEQAGKLDEVLASYRDETRTLMENARDAQDRNAVWQDLRELRSSSLDKAKALLTDAQKATWDTLTGEPFELSFGPGGRAPGRN